MLRSQTYLEKHELRILFVLLLGSFLLYLSFFDDFAVPLSDFIAFHMHSVSYLNFELPPDYKREPLFPVLIGLFSTTFGSSTLFAAETINLVLAIVNVSLVYLISRFFLGRTAFFVALFFAINPSTIEMASQPILETLLLTAVLLTLVLSLKNRAWSYLAAFLASLVRYEGVLLIPILVFKDFFITKKRLRALSLGLLSSTGIIVWIALSIFHHSREVNPYLNQLSLGIGEPRFLLNIPLVVFGFIPGFSLGSLYFKLLVVISSILGLLGMLSLARSSFSSIFPIMSFFLTYFAIHALYPSINAPLRYVWPILWIFYLFIFKGIQMLLSFIEGTSPLARFNSRPLRILAIVCGIIFIFVNFFILKKIYDAQRWLLILSYGAFSLAILAHFFYALKANEFKYLSFFIIPFLIVAGIVGFGLLEANSYLKYNQKYYRAQQREIAEWYAKMVKQGDIMAVSEPEIIRYFAGLKKDYFVALGELKGDTISDFLSDLQKRKVTYLVWDSHYSDIQGEGSRRRFGSDLYTYFSPPVTNHFEVIKEINVEKWRSKSQRAIIYKVRND